MTFTVSTVPAVIAECPVCHQRSNPLDPEKVPEWAQKHEEAHDKEQRRVRMESRGHTITRVVEYIDNDDSLGHAACSCGWVGKSVKVCWITDSADEHLIEAEAQLAKQAMPAVAGG